MVASGLPKSALEVAAPWPQRQVSRSFLSGERSRSESEAARERVGRRQPEAGPLAHVAGFFCFTVMLTVAGLESVDPSFTV